MPKFEVVVEVDVNQTVKFTRTVEANSHREAEEKAKDRVSNEDILEALNLDDVDIEAEAETDKDQCEVCGGWFDTLNADDLCEECEKKENE